MFIELLSNYDDKIFLEAIDQRYNIEKYNKDKIEDNKELNNLEENLKKLNLNFCKSLEHLDFEIDISTEEESDNLSSYSNYHKKYVSMNDILKVDKVKINELKQNMLNNYKYQIEFANQVKAFFINQKIRNIQNKKY